MKLVLKGFPFVLFDAMNPVDFFSGDEYLSYVPVRYVFALMMKGNNTKILKLKYVELYIEEELDR